MTWAKLKEYAFGVLGLSPKEFYKYSYEDYSCLSRGHKLKNALELDKIRTLMFAVYQAAGAKVRRVTDVLQIPLLDGQDAGMNNRLLERAKERIKREKGV